MFCIFVDVMTESFRSICSRQRDYEEKVLQICTCIKAFEITRRSSRVNIYSIYLVQRTYIYKTETFILVKNIDSHRI